MTGENIDITPQGARAGDEPSTGGWSYRPRIDITEDADEFTIFADMPGTSADKIKIEFENRTLSIRGTVEARQSSDMEYLVHEYGLGDFDREIVLSDTVNADRINAEYKRGLLTIHLPKSEEAKPRRIPVRGS